LLFTIYGFSIFDLGAKLLLFSQKTKKAVIKMLFSFQNNYDNKGQL